MKPWSILRSRLAWLARENVDTDQIIPARFLTTTQRQGLGQYCFADWRRAADDAPRADYPLPDPLASGHQILLTGHNFGCGSSREHAPWALLDYGYRAVISSRVADIFRANALKNGLLVIEVEAPISAHLAGYAGQEIEIDLVEQAIHLPSALPVRFAIDAFARRCMLDGVDELGFLLNAQAQIRAFEAARELQLDQRERA